MREDRKCHTPSNVIVLILGIRPLRHHRLVYNDSLMNDAFLHRPRGRMRSLNLRLDLACSIAPEKVRIVEFEIGVIGRMAVRGRRDLWQ